jgi:hypothetical protein
MDKSLPLNERSVRADRTERHLRPHPKLRMAITAAAMTLMASTASAVQAADLSPHLRDVIEDAFAPNLVLPETARWRFDPVRPYLDGQKLVCGWVDYQSAMRTYVGAHRFYAILDGAVVKQAQINDPGQDVSGNLAYKLKLLCGGD